VKRLFREIFRRTAAGIPPHFDLVINAKRGTAEAGFAELREEFLAVAARIGSWRDGGSPC
jgi:ribonuclease P protein component